MMKLLILFAIVCHLPFPVSAAADTATLGSGYTCVDTVIKKKKKVVKVADAKKDLKAQIAVAKKISNKAKRTKKLATLNAILASFKTCGEGGFTVQSAGFALETEQCATKEYDLTVTLLPVRPGRNATLEISSDNGTTWTALSSAACDATGVAALKFNAPETPGIYKYRVTGAAVAKTPAYASPAIEAKVAPCGGQVERDALPAVRGGGVHTCKLDENNEAWCWGENQTGCLGDGTTNDSFAPVKVAGGHHFVAIYPGYEHTCALKDDGSAYCWGQNGTPAFAFLGKGALGNGFTDNSSVPFPVSGGYKFKKLTLGVNFTCGITLQGITYCWGNNYEGEIGDGSPMKTTANDRLLPTQMLFPQQKASFAALIPQPPRWPVVTCSKSSPVKT